MIRVSLFICSKAFLELFSLFLMEHPIIKLQTFNELYWIFFLNLFDLKSCFTLSQVYLNPALNNLALVFFFIFRPPHWPFSSLVSGRRWCWLCLYSSRDCESSWSGNSVGIEMLFLGFHLALSVDYPCH